MHKLSKIFSQLSARNNWNTCGQTYYQRQMKQQVGYNLSNYKAHSNNSQRVYHRTYMTSSFTWISEKKDKARKQSELISLTLYPNSSANIKKNWTHLMILKLQLIVIFEFFCNFLATIDSEMEDLINETQQSLGQDSKFKCFADSGRYLIRRR